MSAGFRILLGSRTVFIGACAAFNRPISQTILLDINPPRKQAKAISQWVLEPQFRADAASIMNLMRTIGGSFGISIIVTLLARNSQISHSELAAHMTESSVASINVGATAERLGDTGTAVLQMLDAEINRQALMISYIDIFVMASAFLFITALSLFFLKPVVAVNPLFVNPEGATPRHRDPAHLHASAPSQKGVPASVAP